MSVAVKAIRGVLWNMSTGIGVRVIGLVTTVVLMRFIVPYDYGEVQAAAICVLTAHQFATFGFGQYIIAKHAGPEACWAATVTHLGLGVLAQGIVLALVQPLSGVFQAPGMDKYVLGFAIAMVIERLYLVPERLLQRDLRFKATALTRSGGELVYIAVALATAPALGAYAIMIGSLARSTFLTVTYLVISDRSQWLRPARVDGKILRELFHFGVPAWVGSASGFAASKWGNLIMSSLYGPSVAGRFAQAYTLADTPTSSVADQIGDVLLPSFSKFEPERRKEMLLRSTGLMALLVFPLAAGLGAVSHTVVYAFFKPEWHPMASMLLVLSYVSVVRPMTWTMTAFAYAQHRPRIVMLTGLWQVAALFGALLTLGRLGPLWACAAVGVAAASYLFLFAVLLQAAEAVSAFALLFRGVPALVASAIMVAAVLAARELRLRAGIDAHVPGLLIEVATGGVAYAGAALLVARRDVNDVLNLVRNAIGRRRAG